jgi:hypothetical protein
MPPFITMSQKRGPGAGGVGSAAGVGDSDGSMGSGSLVVDRGT